MSYTVYRQVEAMVSVGLHGVVCLAPEAAGIVGEFEDQLVGRRSPSGRATAVRGKRVASW